MGCLETPGVEGSLGGLAWDFLECVGPKSDLA
jgi:hypothetical protein